MAAETGQLAQGNRDGIRVAGQSRYGIWDRTTKTGQPGQANLDRSTRRVTLNSSALKGQPGQLSLGRTERKSQDMTAKTGQHQESC
jgi:hypothetical protein